MPEDKIGLDPAQAAEAERLKALGNRASTRADYDEAHRLFSEAINKDPSNAVYYANRAAVLLAQRRHMDAMSDCQTALELDPNYWKAWQRLGTAAQIFGAWPVAINAFAQALETLPGTRQSPEDKAFQQKCMEAIAQVKAQQKKFYATMMPGQIMPGKMPWDIAKVLAPKKAGKRATCAVILNYAYGYFREAMDILANKQMTTGRMTLITTQILFLPRITEAILSDNRIFHFPTNIPNIEERMRNQMQFENNYHRGFLSDAVGPANLKQKMLEKVKSETWDDARRAIIVTIRAWTWSAFLRSEMGNLYESSLGMYQDVLEVLEWGREQFSYIPEDDRGYIFKRTFISTVRSSYLDTLRHYLCSDTGQTQYTLEDALNLAIDIVRDADIEMGPPEFQGMAARENGPMLSYWFYPRARALANMAWCYKWRSVRESEPQKSDSLRKAAHFYKVAAEGFPDDDESYANFMREHLDCLISLKAPLRDTLPVCRQIRMVMPQVLEIWGNYPKNDILRENFKQITEFEDKYYKMIANRDCTLDSVGQLERMKYAAPKTEKDAGVPIGMRGTDERKARMKNLRRKI